MSQPKTKEELVRLAWIAALRREGDRQCCGDLFEAGGMVCALGLIAEAAGLTQHEAYTLCEKGGGFEPIGRLAGLSAHQTFIVWRRNDGSGKMRRHTFAEIADVVEGWFKD